MKKDIRKKNIRECRKDIREHLNYCYKDMSQDGRPLDIKLGEGQVLYCEKCHSMIVGKKNLLLNSLCKASNYGQHDYAIVEGCSERIVFGCAECKDFWWYSCGSKEECLHDFLNKPCKMSKDGKHVPVELLYLTGSIISKPIIEREVCLSVKEVDQKLDSLQLHSVKE